MAVNQVRTAKQTRTEKNIENALRSLLEKEPFDQITIKMICMVAEIHHRTFYRYFTDKYEVLQRILLDFCGEVDADIDEQFTMSIAALIVANWNFIQNITTLNHSNEVYFDLIQMISKTITTSAAKSAASSDNLLRVVQDSPHPDYAAYSFAGMIVGVLIKWGESNTPISQQELAVLLDDTLKDMAGQNACNQ